MTEDEWLNCADPTPMLEFLRGKASDRKLRLFIANYCRCNWHLFHDERCLNAIEVAELFSDGQIDYTELSQTYIEMSQILSESLRPAAGERWQSVRVTPTAIIANTCSRAVRPRITPRTVGLAAEGLVMVLADGIRDEFLQAIEGKVQVGFLRDIFGNLFRPVTINPDWLTPTVSSLAQAAYEERSLPSGELDPARLAVLSDALEEAGCDNSDILNHLRGSGPHVRGCWVLDLLLGKE